MVRLLGRLFNSRRLVTVSSDIMYCMKRLQMTRELSLKCWPVSAAVKAILSMTTSHSST